MLIAKDIQKSFSHPVLSGVTLHASQGELIGLAGKNGSGKSTLLSILTGISPPDSGVVTLNGSSLEKNLNQIGYVPQEPALFDNLSVKDNLRFWASAYGIKLSDQVVTHSHHLAIEPAILKKKVRHLSGGMKKRLSIALACLHQPKYLVMDEPTAALDIGFKGELAQIIEDMRTEGKSVIMTSHQPDELLWCNRIYILRGGVFVYEGDPKELDDLPKALYGTGDN